MQGKPAAVFGLARSGLAAIRALCAAGVQVFAWDDNEKSCMAAKEAGADATPLSTNVLKQCAFLLLSPGVPLHYPEPHAVVKAARAAGTEIICDIEFFHRLRHGCKTIGITGTNGKSTTTALIEHILKEAGMDAVAGGNIGRAVFDLPVPGKDGIFVFELSSYQIDLCPTFRPDIAVLLNITPDHLDRHGTMEQYAAAKERVFEGPGAGVIGTDDDYGWAIFERAKLRGERRMISISVTDTSLMPLMQGSALKGLHNYQNILAAYAVCRELGVSENKIAAAIKTFPGLPHRQFQVRTIGNITYINDSKATNAEATDKALSSFGDIFWIAGGKPKDGGLSGLEKYADRIREAFLIGEAAWDFAIWMKNNGIAHQRSGTMKDAVAAAHAAAQKRGKGTVLLSPACASFDQYTSYEERGDDFTRLVGAL